MSVSCGTVNSSSWKRKIAYDYDLEVVHPWLYETYLIEDDIMIGLTPGKKVAIYRYNFPVNGQKNILIEGTGKMTGKLAGPNAVIITKRIYELK